MIGTLFGSYRVVGVIGGGGMGTIYRAEHTLIGRPAAVKVLNPQFAQDRVVVNRFFNEARAATAIQHPGIVEVFDFGYQPDGSAFIVMEFLQGESLASRLHARGTLLETEAFAIARGIATALGAAHARGIVHRDIKPGNIFLGADDRGLTVRLLDFGLAKSLQSDNALTRTGTLLGTPLYMSPEQVQSRGVGPRSDLYAFAAVCHEALVGERLVRASEFTAICLEVLQTEPPPPSQFLPDLDPRVDAAFAAALKKNPNDRPADLEAWAHDLADALLATRTDILGWPARLLTSDASGDAAAPTQSLAPHHAMEPTLERTGGFQ